MSPSQEQFIPRLLYDLNRLYQGEINGDVVIRVGEETDVKEFKVHSFILRARSPYFSLALSERWCSNLKDQSTGETVFPKPNIQPRVFDTILSYLYTGKVDLSEYDGFDLIELLQAADELMNGELVAYTEDYMIQRKSEWIQQNLGAILNVVLLHDTFRYLRDYCLSIVYQNPKEFFDSAHFLASDKIVVEQILKSDDLDSEEIEIWDNLIKWAKYQHKDDSFADKDVSRWTDEEFSKFGNTLSGLIPHIYFFKISPQDFYLNVCPYRQIIPKDLFEDLLGSYLLPCFSPRASKFLVDMPRKSPINSKIIMLKHAIMIEKWIEKEDNANYGLKNLRYNWELLYQGNKDEFSGNSFHKKCDNQGPTIVLVKICGTEELVGGYNSGDWSSPSSYKRFEKDSFIFSLGSGIKTDNAIISRLTSEFSNSMFFQKSSAGPMFGNDLYISDKCNVNYLSEHRKESYSRAIREPGHFLVEDYEVFKVTKKITTTTTTTMTTTTN